MAFQKLGMYVYSSLIGRTRQASPDASRNANNANAWAPAENVEKEKVLVGAVRRLSIENSPVETCSRTSHPIATHPKPIPKPIPKPRMAASRQKYAGLPDLVRVSATHTHTYSNNGA